MLAQGRLTEEEKAAREQAKEDAKKAKADERAAKKVQAEIDKKTKKVPPLCLL